MLNKEKYFGTYEEWLNTKRYVANDIYFDEFSTNFDICTNKELIDMGINIEKPIFKPKQEYIMYLNKK